MDNKTDKISIDSHPISNNIDVLTKNSNPTPLEPETQKASENHDSSYQNKVESGKESEKNGEKKVRKRTTKKESDVRNYKCSLCNKSYLSYPALYTHCKQKHNTNNHSGRGRGRPPKNGNNEGDGEKTLYDPLNETYFQKEDRKGNTNVEKMSECIKKAFKYLYQNETDEEIAEIFKQGKMKNYQNVESHPFLGKFLLDVHDIHKNIEDEKTPTDLVLMNYLDKMSVYCNEEFYTKLIIFVTLFREHINYINKDKIENGNEFSQTKEAEDVPESSNEFITDFLFPNDQDYGLGFTKDEAIDLTRNLCNWMYINNFTCSKLFLLDKDKE